eukprot:scaffold9970_cov133-Chaetoceros_neogracile.AAC.1
MSSPVDVNFSPWVSFFVYEWRRNSNRLFSVNRSCKFIRDCGSFFLEGLPPLIKIHCFAHSSHRSVNAGLTAQSQVTGHRRAQKRNSST